MKRKPRIDKILMTAETLSGVWPYSLELARALDEFEIRVFLATMGAPLTGEQKAEAARIPNLVIFESGYKLEWMENPWRDVEESGKWLLDLEAKYRPQIVHSNGYAHGSINFQAPVVIAAHSCRCSRHMSVENQEPPPQLDEYRRKVSEGLIKAAAVVAPSLSMMKMLKSLYGRFRYGGVILNGRRPGEFVPLEKEPFVLTAGDINDEALNIKILDHSAQKIKWPVHVAWQASGSESKIVFLGALQNEDKSCWLGRASIFALPARYEPSGLPVLEAALAGCALVLGDVPSLREIWDGLARFVKPDKPESVEDAINRLILDDVLRDSLASKSRRRALDLSPQRMARKYLSVYRSLLGGRSR